MKRTLLAGFILTSSILLSGCNFFENEAGKMKEALKGREVTIQTYDENSNLIDRIVGKSVSISSESKFDVRTTEGEIAEKSSVIGITVGEYAVTHVGSSLIMYEKGLTDELAEYAQTVDLQNRDSAVPLINRMKDGYLNLTTGKDKIILIRSQSGVPLATFVGENVSYFATDMDKSTGLLIDGKYLFIYRADYTIYDAGLFDN